MRTELFKITKLSRTSMWPPTVDANAIHAYTGDSLTVFDRTTGT